MNFLDAKHVMIDLETLAQQTDACLLSLGACEFSFKTKNPIIKTYYSNITPESCKELGLIIDPETVAWWKRQDPRAIKALIPNKKHIKEVANDFKNFFPFPSKDVYLWSHGANFDIPILELVYRRLGIASPWKYWNTMCVRTVATMFGVNIRNIREFEGDYHNALSDAVSQAKILVDIFDNKEQ